jgi:hypothetical protein
MTTRSWKLMSRLPLMLALVIACGCLINILEDYLGVARFGPVVQVGVTISIALASIWCFRTLDEWLWAPTRRISILLHLYLQPTGEPVEVRVLLGELKTGLTYAHDIGYLERHGYIAFREGDAPRGGTVMWSGSCCLTAAGRTWLERNPIIT